LTAEKAEEGDKVRGEALKAQVLQDKLQRYLDEIDLEGVAAAIAGGAIVDASHIRQVAQVRSSPTYPEIHNFIVRSLAVENRREWMTQTTLNVLF
jgi:hypothetical protein